MNAPNPLNYNLLDRTNCQHGGLVDPAPLLPGDHAHGWLKFADCSPLSRRQQTKPAYLRDSVRSQECSLKSDRYLSNDGKHLGINRTDLHQISCKRKVPETDDQKHQAPKPRTLPCSFAVRYSNRPNGTPLTTIVEQRSFSTLGSRPSLFNASRRLPPVDPSTPAFSAVYLQDKGRRRASQSLDEVILHQIHEVEKHEWESNTSRDILNTVEREVDLVQAKRSTSSQNENLLGNHDKAGHNNLLAHQSKNTSRSPRAGLWDLLQTVRQASLRSRSLSVSRSRASLESLGPRWSNFGGMLRAKQIDNVPNTTCSKRHAIYQPLPAIENYSSPLSQRHLPLEHTYSDKGVVDHGEERIIEENLSSFILVDQPDALLSQIPSTYDLSPNSSSSTPSPSQFPHPPSTRSLSTGSTQPSICNAPQDRSRSDPTTFSVHSGDDLFTCYTSDGVGIYCKNDLSPREQDRAREVSIGSSLSTSYSGSVIGVDLDLQAQRNADDRRFVSTTSCRATPTLSLDLTSPVSAAPSRDRSNANTFTSAALPTLLPLALASGIVRPANVPAPHISFYSPSGNLIRMQDCELTAATPHHLAYEPLARPAIILSTTPPETIARLPAHLRHHHNSMQHSHTCVVPQSTDPLASSTRTSPSNVKGCDGIVRSRSLVPRSGVYPKPSKGKPMRWSRRYHEYGRKWFGTPRVKTESRGHCGSTSTSQVCGTAQIRKRSSLSPKSDGTNARRLHKRSVEKRKPKPNVFEAYGVSAHGTSSEASGPGDPAVGAAVGWTLRVCFCQPWDGVGSGCSSSSFQLPHLDAESCDNVRVIRPVRRDSVLDR